MTMGDRIKTRQQLLDEQADAAHTRATPGDDRHEDPDRDRSRRDQPTAEADVDEEHRREQHHDEREEREGGELGVWLRVRMLKPLVFSLRTTVRAIRDS